MANPIQPTTLPMWCTTPVEEKITFTDPTTGETQIINQLNIATPDPSVAKNGFIQANAVVEQDLNWLFNTIYNWIVYLNASVNQPPSYLTANLPAASSNTGLLVFVTDIDAGVLAISNGTNWIKLTMNGSI